MAADFPRVFSPILPPTCVSFFGFPKSCFTWNFGHILKHPKACPPNTVHQPLLLPSCSSEVKHLRLKQELRSFPSSQQTGTLTCSASPHPNFPELLKHHTPNLHSAEQKDSNGARQEWGKLGKMHCSGLGSISQCWRSSCTPREQIFHCFSRSLRQLSPGTAVNKVMDQPVRVIQGVKWCLIQMHRASLMEIFPLFSSCSSS